MRILTRREEIGVFFNYSGSKVLVCAKGLISCGKFAGGKITLDQAGERPIGQYSTAVLYLFLRSIISGKPEGKKHARPGEVELNWKAAGDEVDVVRSFNEGPDWCATNVEGKPSWVKTGHSKYHYAPKENEKMAQIHTWYAEEAADAAYTVYQRNDHGARFALRLNVADNTIRYASGSDRVYKHPPSTRLRLRPEGSVYHHNGPAILREFLQELAENNLIKPELRLGWEATAEEVEILAEATQLATK